jgi:hypothetical protein
MSNNFEVGKTYNFDVHPSKIYGNTFTNMTVAGIFDYSTATALADIDAMHENAKPYVPNIPNSPTKYSYIKFKQSSGEYIIFGLPWIRDETIKLVDSNIIEVQINNVSPSDIPKVKAALSQNGFTELKINVLNI